MTSLSLILAGACACALAWPADALAQSAAPSRRITLSAYMQLQHERTTQADDERDDRTYFRRIIVGVRGELTRQWTGLFTIDLSPLTTGDRVNFRDTYLQYRGFEPRRLRLTAGSQKTPFSRSYLTTASRRSLVERSFAGDRDYGTPRRLLSLKVDGWNTARKALWSAAVGRAFISRSFDHLRLEGIRGDEGSSDAGVLAGGRLDVHPAGEVPRDQRDFEGGRVRSTIGAAAYLWHRTGAREAVDPVQIRQIAALEVSGGLRGHRLSLDAEYHYLGADAGQPANAGWFSAGRARLHLAALEGGYMVVPRRVELSSAFDLVDVGTYARVIRRASAGATVYILRDQVRLQITHRETFDDKGVPGARARTTYIQAQLGL